MAKPHYRLHVVKFMGVGDLVWMVEWASYMTLSSTPYKTTPALAVAAVADAHAAWPHRKIHNRAAYLRELQWFKAGCPTS